MEIDDIVMGLFIHLLIPALGLVAYLKVYLDLKKEQVSPFVIKGYFFLFFHYGGVLVVILTHFFWEWSGMASIGTMYLCSIAPIIMGVISFKLRYMFRQLRYHNILFWGGLVYMVLILVTVLILT